MLARIRTRLHAPAPSACLGVAIASSLVPRWIMDLYYEGKSGITVQRLDLLHRSLLLGDVPVPEAVPDADR